MENCTHCGGSGIQRISQQRFRTCLNCLGQSNRSANLLSADLRSLEVNNQKDVEKKSLIAAAASSAR